MAVFADHTPDPAEASRDDCYRLFRATDNGFSRTPEDRSAKRPGPMVAHNDVIDPSVLADLENVFSNSVRGPEFPHIIHNIDVLCDSLFLEKLSGSLHEFVRGFRRVIGEVNDLKFGLVFFGEANTEIERSATAVRSIDRD